MNIGAWAFSSDAEERGKKCMERYKEMKNKGISIYCDSMRTGYAHTVYEGVVVEDMGEELTTFDIGLLCDSGNLCFGGRGSYNPETRRFNFTVNTD